MPKTPIPTLNLPVISRAPSWTWMASVVSNRIRDALAKTDGACTAILLEAPETTQSRPSSISFLCPTYFGTTRHTAESLPDELLEVLAPAALLLDNHLDTPSLFSVVNRGSIRPRGGRFSVIAVTGNAVIGWERNALLAHKDRPLSDYADGGVIGAVLDSDQKPHSAHWFIEAQAELAHIATQIYDFEISVRSSFATRKMYRQVNFKVTRPTLEKV